ncbi:MAG: hypothetical protein US42_C0008G0067 [Candidatus Magasanikbacteria bacterium GW2011_GWC2_37_14]|uniref:DUF4134 domain-containing protein n=1 Tax=Candidatus Magasanikbacteria bacterium GW2011_GWC2_37_14 TaxID=1619046 RepID=A0A0G0JHF4_9BACT|nr:MAG: hypothetical protein US42_C0008G0067 [Candidatus Magasanikbacteria bacterium GW2011_GWC2_37_14]
MNIKKIILIAIFSLLLCTPVLAKLNLGTGIAGQAAVKAGYEGNTSEITFSQNIGTVINAALSLVGVIFLVLMVYAGYLWMTARGSEEEITKAKGIIIAAMIGLILVVGAYSITTFVVPRILASGVKTP